MAIRNAQPIGRRSDSRGRAPGERCSRTRLVRLAAVLSVAMVVAACTPDSPTPAERAKRTERGDAGLLASPVAMPEEATTPSPAAGTAEDLAAVGRAFYVGMAAEDPELNRRAMAAIAPTEDDFRALFGDRYEVLWDIWGPETEALLATVAERSPDYREGLPIVDVQIRDLREDADLLMGRSLGELPSDVPVLGGIIELSDGSMRPARSFVFTGGRWVWIWDIERLAPLLAAAG